MTCQVGGGTSTTWLLNPWCYGWAEEVCSPSWLEPWVFRHISENKVVFPLHLWSSSLLQALEGICQKKRALSKPLGSEKGNGPQHLSCFPLWCRNTRAECQNRTGCLLQSHRMTSLLCPFLRQTVQTTVTAYSCRAMHIPLPCKEGSDPAGEASQIDTLWNRFFFS